MRIEVGEGAMLRVRSVAAAVALPGRENLRSFATWDCAVAGLLDLDPAPTIVAANASHHSHVTVRGSVGVGLRLRERVQIGRAGSHRDSGAANSTPTSALRRCCGIALNSVPDR